MRKVRGSLFVSLDGVIQAPGGPSEDPTGGFAHGGWVAGVFDEAVGEAIGEVFAEPYDLLLGRRTYDIFAARWPHAEGDDAAMGEAFTAADKYVLTRGGADLGWANSHALAGIDAVAALKRGTGPDLVIQGSSTLYPQLLAAGLLDRLTLFVFPVVLGRGKRWFGDGTPAGMLRMTEHRVTPAGTIVASYEPGEAVPTGDFAIAPGSERELARQQRMAEGTW
jgi:dihydrofolate reductase